MKPTLVDAVTAEAPKAPPAIQLPTHLSREDGLEWQAAALAVENQQLRLQLADQARQRLADRMGQKYQFSAAEFEIDNGLLKIVRK